MIDYKDAKDALQLSKHHLDDACEQQSDLFLKVIKKYTDAISERDALKEEIELVDAELDKKIRTKAEKDGIKITEAKIKADIVMSKEHQEAFSEYLEKCQEAANWQALKEAFIQRANMIRILADLYVSSYYNVDVSNRNTDQAATTSIRRAMRRNG